MSTDTPTPLPKNLLELETSTSFSKLPKETGTKFIDGDYRADTAEKKEILADAKTYGNKVIEDAQKVTGNKDSGIKLLSQFPEFNDLKEITPETIGERVLAIKLAYATNTTHNSKGKHGLVSTYYDKVPQFAMEAVLNKQDLRKINDITNMLHEQNMSGASAASHDAKTPDTKSVKQLMTDVVLSTSR